MPVFFNHHTRKVLDQSIEDVVAHQEAAVSLMTRHLTSEVVGSPRDQITRSTSSLFALLIDQAESLARTGECSELDEAASLLASNGVSARDFSPFGCKLAEVLPSAVPACRRRIVTSAWCDAFWSIMLSMPRRPNLLKPSILPEVRA